MLDFPIVQEGFPLFEEVRDPVVTDVCIERLEEVINHPEDRLTALGLTEAIAFTGTAHLLGGQIASGDERLKEVEVISPTSLDHRSRGQHEVNLLPGLRLHLFLERLKTVAKDIVPFHNGIRNNGFLDE